jgi:hypothetical protein
MQIDGQAYSVSYLYNYDLLASETFLFSTFELNLNLLEPHIDKIGEYLMLAFTIQD